MALEDFTIDFPCPKCKQKFEVGLYKLLRELETITCPTCGGIRVEAETEQLEDGSNSPGKSLPILCSNDNPILPSYTVLTLQKNWLN